MVGFLCPGLGLLRTTGGRAGGLFLGLGGLACPKVGGRGLMPGGGVPVGGRRSFKGLPNITSVGVAVFLLFTVAADGGGGATRWPLASAGATWESWTVAACHLASLDASVAQTRSMVKQGP